MLSMTGFGSASIETPRGKLVVEIQAVNRKHLEVQVALPRGFARGESEVRKAVSAALQRGAVSVRITLSAQGSSAQAPDVEALRALKASWESAAVALGIPKSEVSLAFLVGQLGEEPALEETDLPLLACLESALEALQAMRRSEGAALARDIAGRLQNLQQLVAHIEAKTPDATAKLRQTLSARLTELLGASTALDERILREVAVFAEKADIAEEIVRFRSHLAQYDKLLTQEGSGRKMDFLLQEMGREINTIGSKAMDATIQHLVVEAKAELEKIREQVQNIL